MNYFSEYSIETFNLDQKKCTSHIAIAIIRWRKHLCLGVHKMNLVFSFDEGYANAFKVLLHSIFMSNSGRHMNIYLLHDDMPTDVLADLQESMDYYQYSFFPINCRKHLEQSEDFRINRYYTIEMYLWLFAPYLLPEEVDRALYLDPDIININSFNSFYNQSFEDNLFVAMDYKIKNQIIQPINNLRLGTKAAENYFNTGVVLMNIEKLRTERNPVEISQAVIKNKAILILPDQDIFNHLYHGQIKEASWEIYNVDPRLYQVFQLVSPETYNQGWLEEEAVFIHYAGKHKPWVEREKYKLDLGKYYFEYEKMLIDTYTERESEVIDGKEF